jgi:hypothetical protein
MVDRRWLYKRIAKIFGKYRYREERDEIIREIMVVIIRHVDLRQISLDDDVLKLFNDCLNLQKARLSKKELRQIWRSVVNQVKEMKKLLERSD